MSDDNFSIKSDSRSETDSMVSFTGERQLSQTPSTASILDISVIPKSLSDARKLLKRKSKQKKKSALSSWSNPIPRKITFKRRRSTASLVSFKAEPIKLSVTLLRTKSHRQSKNKEKSPTKTLEEIIESLTRSNSVESIITLSSSMNADIKSVDDYTEDTLSQKEKFLLTFEDLPDLSDISSTLSLNEKIYVKKIDYGRIVPNIDRSTSTVSEESSSSLLVPDAPPPVNDVLLTTIPNAAVTEESVPPLNEDSFITGETEFTDSRDDHIVKSSVSTESVSLLQLPSFECFDHIKSRISTDNEKMIEELEMYVKDELNQMSESTAKMNNIESEHFIKLKQHENTIELVKHFLEKLINDTLYYIESKDKKSYEGKFNRTLILNDLMEAIEDFRYEQELEDILNDRIIGYFYRHRNFQHILPTKSEEIYKIRFQTALNNLDNAFNVYNVTFDLCKIQVEDLQRKVAVMRLQTHNQDMELERFVREAISSRPEFKKIQKVADDLLKHMSKLRNEVSKKRLKLILKEHDVLEIKDKLYKMEHIGKGISVSTFISTQQEVRSIGKKIRERNADLKRYAIKARSILHMLAHCKSKGVMINEDLKVARKEVATKTACKTQLRKRIYELTKEHNKLRQDLNEIKTNGTIQQYPLLIDDYDKTVEANKEKRYIVEDLRIQHDYLVWRIENLEKRLRQNQDLKFSKTGASRSALKRTSKLLSNDMSKAISRALSRYGSDDNKFKEFISSIGIDPVSYEIDYSSKVLTSISSSSHLTASSQV